MPETIAVPTWEEREFQLGSLRLTLCSQGASGGRPVLALHGWRDNAATFSALAPLLPECRLHAPDLPGHGRSAWRPPEGDYYIWSYLEEVQALLNQLALERCTLLGHSMGGAIACLFAALFPERVDKLILLDAVGPLTTAPADAPGQLRRALEQKARRKARPRRHYRSFDEAVAARAANDLGLDAARVLGERGIVQDEAGFRWTLDPRLGKPNPMSLSEAHVEVMLRAISCPILLVAATAYWTERRAWFEQRVGYFQHLRHHELPGGHHQHLEHQVEPVAALIRAFLAEG